MYTETPNNIGVLLFLLVLVLWFFYVGL